MSNDVDQRLAALSDQITAMQNLLMSHIGAVAVLQTETFDGMAEIARAQRTKAKQLRRPLVALFMDAMLADLGELRALAVG